MRSAVPADWLAGVDCTRQHDEPATARRGGLAWLRLGRLGPVLGVAALAPVTAELLQAYLGDIGGVFGLVAVVVFLAPLYGGAALLIREIAVRTGRGWPGRLLLATAFGVAMPTLVDVSLFTVHRPDIDDWEQIVSAAPVGSIGISAVVTWVGGHALMSIAAPLATVESLSQTRGPWLGKIGLAVTATLMLLVAAAVHHDQVSSYDVKVDALHYAVSAAVVTGLVALALTPLGRPVRRAHIQSAPQPWVCAAVGLVLIAAFDLVPLSWLGVAIDLTVLALGGSLVLRWSRSPGWDRSRIATLTFGGLLARTLIGFLAPLPQNTTWAAKISQNLLYLALVLALGSAMTRRTETEHSPTATG